MKTGTLVPFPAFGERDSYFIDPMVKSLILSLFSKRVFMPHITANTYPKAEGDRLVSIQNIPAALCGPGLGLGGLVCSVLSLSWSLRCKRTCELSFRWSIYTVVGLPKP